MSRGTVATFLFVSCLDVLELQKEAECLPAPQNGSWAPLMLVSFEAVQETSRPQKTSFKRFLPNRNRM